MGVPASIFFTLYIFFCICSIFNKNFFTNYNVLSDFKRFEALTWAAELQSTGKVPDRCSLSPDATEMTCASPAWPRGWGDAASHQAVEPAPQNRKACLDDQFQHRKW